MSGNIGGEQRGVNLAGNPSKTSVTAPASRQADAALERLASRTWFNYGSRENDLATVRDELARLREERDACLVMASAEMPPDHVFRAIQRAHGLPETGRPEHPAEARVRTLEDGLREIEQTAAGEADEALRAFAAALLSDQPDDQDDPTAGLPDDLARLLRDPRIVVPQDSAVWTLVGEARLPDGRNLWDALRDWQNAPSNTPSADQPDGGETK